MRRRNLFLTALLFGLAVSIFLATRPTKSAKETTAAPQQQAAARPDHVAYWFLFHRVNALKRKADELERQGGKTSLRRAIKDSANLTDAQAVALERIASDCEREVAQVDARAKLIIDSIRSRYPGGKVPRGEKPPPPPPELSALQEERNAIILRARDRLSAAYGDQEFRRLNSFVKNQGVNRPRPGTPDDQ